MNSEIETLKLELAAFKRNNEELIHRYNAAIASWDEERERGLREANRVMEWREKYEDLVKYIRFIGFFIIGIVTVFAGGIAGIVWLCNHVKFV